MPTPIPDIYSSPTPSPGPGPSPIPDIYHAQQPKKQKLQPTPVPDIYANRPARKQPSKADIGKSLLGTPEKLWGFYRGKPPGVPEIPGDSSHSTLDQLFSLPDYFTIDLLHAAREGKLGDYAHLDPAEATDKYGFNAQDYLQWLTKHGTKYEQGYAQYILKHPKAGGGLTALWEFINPGQIATGKGMEVIGNSLYNYLRLSEKGRQFLNLFSPFRGIAKASEKAKWALMAMVNATRHADETAFNDVYRIFNGLTRDEQIDVVRRMQRGKVIPPGYDKVRLTSGQKRLSGHPEYENVGKMAADFGSTAQEMEPKVGTFERGGTFIPGEGKIHPKIASKKNLDQRAYLLHVTLRKATKEQKELGLLKDGQIFDDERYFPMYGAYNNPEYEPDDFIQSLRNLQGGTPYAIPPIRPKHFLNIDEALGSGNVRADWTPANQLMKHMSRRRQALVAESYLRDYPGFEDVIRRPGEADVRQNLHAQTVEEGPEVRVEHRRAKPALNAEPPASQMLPAPKIEPGTGLALRQQLPAKPEEDLGWAFKKATQEEHTAYTRNTLPKGWMYAEDALPGVKLLPALKGAIVRQEFGDWLREHGGSMLSGDPVYLLSKSIFGSKAAEWLNRYNTAYRAAIIANPAYHLLWNIVWNGSAAMGRSPHHLIENTARAVAGIARSAIPGLDSAVRSLGPKVIGDKFIEGANNYADAVREAIMAGATAEWGGPKTALGTMKSIDLFTQPWGSLKFNQRMDRLASSMQEWNRRAVFGPLGEQKFATTLYTRLSDRLIKQGWTRNDAMGRAAELTREALGNYQNVDPNDILSQLFFFYPWLKSNTTFWAKQFLVNPGYTAAPLLGIRNQNQLAGDPNFSTGRFSTPDFNMYNGPNEQGASQYTTFALPQRLPVAMANALGRALPASLGGEGDLMAPMEEGQRIAESHANPAAAFTTGMITTTLEQMKADVDPHVGANYDVIFEKDAPLRVKLEDSMKWGLDHAIPMPLIQYTVEDMIRTGTPASEIPGKLRDNMVQIMGGGYTHAKESKHAGLAIYKAHSVFEKNVKKAQRSYDRHHITGAQLESRVNRLYETYKRQRDKILQGHQ